MNVLILVILIVLSNIVQPEWTYTLSDATLDISMVDDKTSPTIAILGTHFLNPLLYFLQSQLINTFYAKFII